MSIVCTQLGTRNSSVEIDEHCVYATTYHECAAISFSFLRWCEVRKLRVLKSNSYRGDSLRTLHKFFDHLFLATVFTPELLCETRCSPLRWAQRALLEGVQCENRRK